jgi:hypothetical protein
LLTLPYCRADSRKSPDYTKIINKQHCRRLKALLDDTDHYELVCGGVVDEDACFVAPTIVRNVSEDSKLMQDEISLVFTHTLTYLMKHTYLDQSCLFLAALCFLRISFWIL